MLLRSRTSKFPFTSLPVGLISKDPIAMGLECSTLKLIGVFIFVSTIVVSLKLLWFSESAAGANATSEQF
ncbi:hypothetical protein D3C87_1691420 [compost metagenome]